MDNSSDLRNDESRARLRGLVARVSEADLATSLGGGWTVSAALAHLAFRDQYASTRLEEWIREGALPASGGYDALNDALVSQWLAIPPQEAARLAVAAAEALDQKVAALAPDKAEAIAAAGRPRLLDRSKHRQEHLDQIERAIAAG
ncbi:MAG: maleylpyruvate isomerase N-terminal domain-containing protein [Dehalococcoidales bacterium]|nr:maleylpyruvate isomerase N-terminal domain-containing protein [Dehalococcoidales bacterium]